MLRLQDLAFTPNAIFSTIFKIRHGLSLKLLMEFNIFKKYQKSVKTVYILKLEHN